MNRQTQCQTVWSHMRRHGPIDARTASRRYDIDRLAARICDLRKRVGRDKIRSLRVTSRSGKHFASYFIVNKNASGVVS